MYKVINLVELESDDVFSLSEAMEIFMDIHEKHKDSKAAWIALMLIDDEECALMLRNGEVVEIDSTIKDKKWCSAFINITEWLRQHDILAILN